MRSLVEGTIIAAAVSMAMSSIVLATFSRESASRYAGALGLAAGFAAAYARLEPYHWIPTAHWHWLPWLVAAGAIVGPVAIAAGVALPERWALWILLALAAAWLLVPVRASLPSQRSTYIVAVAGSLALLWSLLDPLTRRCSGVAMVGTLWVSLVSGSALVAVAVSLRIGSLGIIGAAAIAGSGLAAIWRRDATIIRGLLGCFSIILGAVLLTAQLNDGVRIPVIALIVLSPAMLWLFQAGPLSRLPVRFAGVARWTAVCLPHVVAWGICLSEAGALPRS